MQRFVLFTLTFLTLSVVGFAQSKEKKVQTFTVSHIIQAPAAEVWQVVGEDYGAIANSHPKIIKSDYVDGSLRGGEGVERVCYFNEKETQFLKEKQMLYDPENYTFKNQVYQAGKFPVDPLYTYAIYRVEPIDATSSRFVFDMTYRTTPSFLGGMMKGTFKKMIADYAVAIEHHIRTGESVTKENFKEVKKAVR